MVRILANGEIVQDDDPRVRNSSSSHHQRNHDSSRGETSTQYFRRQVVHEYEGRPTMFETWNQKLLELGIPRWNIGNHVVEPLVTVMALFVLLLAGFQGLLFLGVLYFVVQMSQRRREQDPPHDRNNRDRSSREFGGGGGHRLGS